MNRPPAREPLALLRRLRREFRKLADPARAQQMQRYMKSAMPFHGITTPQLRAICRTRYRDLEFESAAQWRKTVLEIWRGARFREERHAAILLTGIRQARAFQTMTALPLYETMIVEGAWWDYVDSIATHPLGELLRNAPKPMRKAMLAWSRGENLWKRRSAILCQIGFKEETDLDLLYRCLEPSLASREFFLRKAIGWALRQYAWTNPAEVRRYVRAHEDELSSLSKREATKNLQAVDEPAID
ncbi:MAG TPA: DNA alkylation repair protein [Thermoanaerobaculia bacterium]